MKILLAILSLFLFCLPSKAQNTTLRQLVIKTYGTDSADLFFNVSQKTKSSELQLSFGQVLGKEFTFRSSSGQIVQSGFIGHPELFRPGIISDPKLIQTRGWGKNGLNLNFTTNSGIMNLRAGYVGLTDFSTLQLGLNGSDIKGFTEVYFHDQKLYQLDSEIDIRF